MSPANLLRLLVLGAIWGGSFLLIKLSVEGLSPIQLVLGRLLTGSAVLLVIAATRRIPLPREPRLWGHLAVMAVVANIVPFALFGYGEQRIASGLAGVLNGTTPLFTLLVAVGAARFGASDERLTGPRIAGLCIGFLGTVLVIGPWREGALGGTILGQLACLAAAAFYGLAFVYTRRFITPSGYSPVALSTAQLLCATAILGLGAPVLTRGPMNLTPTVVASVTVLGALMTGLAYLLYYRLVAEAGATSASMVTYIVPVVAVVLGALILGEPLLWNLFAGAAVIIFGVALAEGRVGGARRRPDLPPTPEAPVPPEPAGARR